MFVFKTDREAEREREKERKEGRMKERKREKEGRKERRKERGVNRAITQPFGSDILFSSQTWLDVSVPLVCYCRAEALVVDHCENCEAQGTVVS